MIRKKWRGREEMVRRKDKGRLRGGEVGETEERGIDRKERERQFWRKPVHEES